MALEGQAQSAGPKPAEFLAPPQAADELGRLGNYRILKELGAGGMGMVFLAEDPQLRRRIALKVMAPALAAEATARQRFLREAQATAALHHDNVVTIYQVAEDRGVPYLAMELLAGESLETRLHRDGRLPLAETLRIGREIAAGLDAAHEQQLIHRDIKPGNIWLEARRGQPSRVKILDFGLAHFERGDERLTQSGTVLGTPHYMSPEQAGGESVDHRGDLFSLGCVLYRLTTGRLPFAGSNLRSTLKAVIFESPPPVLQLVADAPPALAQLIERLLAKEPKDRPQSPAEVVAALAALEAEPAAKSEQPVAPGPETMEYRPAGALTGAPAAPQTMIPRPPARSRRRTWALIGAGLAAVAAVVSVLVLVNPFKPRPAAFRLEADEVLNRLAGTWQFQIDEETAQPKLIGSHGTIRYEWIANEKFLRAYTSVAGGFETLLVYRYDPQAKGFRRWSFGSEPGPLAIHGPGEGHFDAATQTLSWRDSLPLFHKLVQEDRWAGADDFETYVEIKGNQGAVVMRQTIKMHRITTNEIAGPSLPRDAKRPAELAVLDGLLGSWSTSAQVTLAELGNRKVQSESTHEATAILAGRFIEGHEHNQAVGRKDCWLAGWDEFRRAYRLWHFGADGDALEADGTWDKAEKKLTWKSLDGRFGGTWTLTSANERHSVMAAKDAQGRRLYEVDAVSRRVHY